MPPSCPLSFGRGLGRGKNLRHFANFALSLTLSHWEREWVGGKLTHFQAT
ncbi:hypothetical protein [Alysiella filiformis]|nr:hypothetical protein [Alysiella filiformis]